ncbi:MAG: cache domain-containing protein [Candidatus Hydrogenedentes bacterium]|nr:cache domain-containing protein [Candidatus Hydrogenedentota bacterium]
MRKINSLKTKLIGGLILVFLSLSIAISILQMEIVNRLVIRSSNERIKLNMRSGWFYLNQKISKLEMLCNFIEELCKYKDFSEHSFRFQVENIARLYIEQRDLDWVWIDKVDSSISGENKAFYQDLFGARQSLSGYIKIPRQLLDESHFISMSNGTHPKLTDSPLAMFSAKKISCNQVDNIYVFLGIWLEEANYIVDQIQGLVFEDRFYNGKRVGTVTIFNEDLRVATTVLLPDDRRAVGTYVSIPVKQKTLKNGEVWIGRAQVLDDWYLACYEPILDHKGKIIGMLYMGELERVSKDIRFRTILITISTIIVIMIFAFLVRLRQTTVLLRRIRTIGGCAKEFASGNFSVRIPEDKENDELSELSKIFNKMMETVEKDRDKLLEQQRMIEEANNNYLEMLGFVTHELRNTLGSALFNLLSVKEGTYGEISESVNEGLSIVEDSLIYLKDITNNYLQLSKLESGDLYVEKRDLYLITDVIEPVILEFRKLLDSKKMELIIDIQEDFHFPADPNLMRVVYENLIGNAIKYGKEEGSIKLSARKTEDFIELVVWNDGEPIDQSIIPTLFHKFRRYDVKPIEGRRGSGLGLFIVKRIVEIHGGVVTVESSEQKGTSFIIKIPRS